MQCTVYLGTKLGQTVNYQLLVIKETKGYVCNVRGQIIEGSPDLFRVVDQQSYEKANVLKAHIEPTSPCRAWLL